MQIQSLDVSNKPDIRRIAEEVQENNIIRVLNRKNEPLAAVVPMEIYEQWEKEGEEILAIIDKAAKKAQLSSKEAEIIADEAVHVIRTA